MSNDFRKYLYNNLNQKSTEELIEIWQENDREEWSDIAFESIQEILQNRLETLPPQGVLSDETSIHPKLGQHGLSDENDPISMFKKKGDIGALVDILENEIDPIVCLKAAKALAELDDERGLDYLINALEIPDTQVNEAVKEILAQINHPQGNLALQTYLAKNIPPMISENEDTLSAKYPYLTGYVGFLALSTLVGFILGFLPEWLRFVLSAIIGFYVFKFVVQKNILPYINSKKD